MTGVRPVGPLPTSQRVRRRREFLAIQSTGRRVNTRHFILLLARGTAGAAEPRLGITASRRVGGAVLRNRAKRLVREAFRATRELWPAQLDLVVIVKSMDGTIKLQDVVREWRSATRLIRAESQTVLSDAP